MSREKTISNHPDSALTAVVKRKIVNMDIKVSEHNKGVILKAVVKNFKTVPDGEGGTVDADILGMPDLSFTAHADNSTKVNPQNGNIIEPWILDEQGNGIVNPDLENGIGEYDFLYQMQVAAGDIGDRLFGIVDSYITLLDARGFFGEDLYNSVKLR